MSVRLPIHPLIIDLGREYRGGQHQAFLLLQGLLELGHAPELMAQRESVLAVRAAQLGVTVHLCDPKRRRLTAAQQIRSLLGDRKADLVHANEPHALTAAWLARAHRAVPMVVSRRIALPIPENRFSLARYRAAARVIAISHFVEQSVTRSGIPSSRVSVIYDGVRIPAEISLSQRKNARDQLGVGLDNLCIGNVAAFVPEKGHALLLEAFTKLRAQFPKCVLALLGEGPELPRLQSLAQSLRVTEAVKFLPAGTEIEIAFAAMDIFAFPSHAEPLGSALLAAMSHALPVVAIARGGVPEVIADGKNGLLVSDLDPSVFASAITRLIQRPAEGASTGRSAAETIKARFSAEGMASESLRLYENLGERNAGLSLGSSP